MNADTGVSRSPVMSKSDCNAAGLQMRTGEQKTHPGVIRRWVFWCRRKSLSREKQPAVSPLRYEVRHHQRRAVLRGGCDMLRGVSPCGAGNVKPARAVGVTQHV